VLLLATLVGCAAPPGPIFPGVNPPIAWPAPPDTPRIRYIGALHGEASLGIQPTGWEAVRAALGGPRPQVAFSHPAAIAVAGERIFVADTGLGAVHLLDLAARQYKLLRGAPADPLRVPIGLTISAGQLVVVDRGRAAIDLFDLDGNWRTTRRWPEVTAPVAVAWDQQKRTLWIADAAAHACFVVADLQTVSGRLGDRGTAPGQFNFPTALAWQPMVGLVVADAMNFRVQVFDTAGQPMAVFGRKGDAAGCFARPRGVAVDSEGHIYVADNQFENIQVFDAAGRLLLAFGEEGDRPGQFSLPAGITIDAQDRIWVADSYNRRVQVFQYVAEKG
jgi:DNA-binding beta-propeller fold protein YncE